MDVLLGLFLLRKHMKISHKTIEVFKPTKCSMCSKIIKGLVLLSKHNENKTITCFKCVQNYYNEYSKIMATQAKEELRRYNRIQKLKLIKGE